MKYTLLLCVCVLSFQGSLKAATKLSLNQTAMEKQKLAKLKSKIRPRTKKSQSEALQLVSGASLEKLYLYESKSKSYIQKLKLETLKQEQKAVPILVEVMKNKKFPDGNRWVATFMLGKIMGVKSANFISKFTKHPNWMMRLASLKVLLHLNQKRFKNLYADALEDKSLIVRYQALQIIREMKLKDLAQSVWKMVYDKNNYVGAKGARKRSHIIGDAIKTVGELELHSVKVSLHKMIKSPNYKDLYSDLDYSLSKLYKQRSPAGSLEVKKKYWKNMITKNKKRTI